MLPVNDFRMFWREEILTPTADGNYNGIWYKSSDCGAANVYTMVDEAVQNGDTDFALTDNILLGGPTCGNFSGPGKHSFVLSDIAAISASDTILSVTPHNFTKKSGASDSTFRAGLRESSTDVFGGNETLTTAYVDYVSKQASKPSGGGWTISAVNGTEAVIESVSIGNANEQRVTQVYVAVEYIIMTVADLTLALTGNGFVGSPGILFPERTVSPGGNSAAAMPGNLAAALNAALNGNGLTASPGNLLFASALPLGGMALTGAVGTVTADGVPAVTGPQQVTRISINRRGSGISIKGG